ncbi:MAG: GNAT family N-acetyltransferase [Candidatus Levybacteria bacterium]|nr:GNAT family N-acetyltransferase [Candidatus Levybacteria bacterium]
MKQNEIILTQRLKLVQLSPNHAVDIFNEFTQEVTIYMFPKTPHKLEETQEYIKESLEKMSAGEEIQFVILLKDTGEFLGGGGIHDIKTTKPELGIWVKKSAHGNKYGLEAVRGMKEWAENNLEYQYLVYPVDKRNIASRKIAEALGGVVEAEYKKPNL